MGLVENTCLACFGFSSVRGDFDLVNLPPNTRVQNEVFTRIPYNFVSCKPLAACSWCKSDLSTHFATRATSGLEHQHYFFLFVLVHTALILCTSFPCLSWLRLDIKTSAAMREATEGTRELVSSVSSPLSNFFNSLNTSTYEVELLLSSTDWLGEFEDGTLLRLDAFNSAHRHV